MVSGYTLTIFPNAIHAATAATKATANRQQPTRSIFNEEEGPHTCNVTDTYGRCKLMIQGYLWICLVGITPSNNPGTKREILPYLWS